MLNPNQAAVLHIAAIADSSWPMARGRLADVVVLSAQINISSPASAASAAPALSTSTPSSNPSSSPSGPLR